MKNLNAPKIQTLVVCQITKKKLSYQSFIYIFRNFEEHQSHDNGGLKKQFKRTSWNMDESGEIASKIRILFSSYYFVQMVAEHGQIL